MSDSEESIELETGDWITWFCSLDDHQFLCEVDSDFIREEFNLFGIKQKFKNFIQCLELILSPQGPDDEELENEKYLELYQEAAELYGLIHSRYILTQRGLAKMREKFMQGLFGQCPRILCEKQNAAPIGLSNDLKISRVKIFCPRCKDIFQPKKKCTDVDGAYFGLSFPHILLQSYPDLIIFPKNNEVFEPTIYGFKLYKNPGSKYLDGFQKKQIKQNQNNHVVQSLEEQVSKISLNEPKKKNKNKNKKQK